jgi:hypothetical protein
VFDHINAADGEQNKFLRGRAYLINLFEAGSDRDRIYALPLRDQKELTDARKTVEDELRGYFDRAAAAQDPQGNAVEPAERRRRIAHVLYNIDRSADWHQRVQTLMGLTSYVAAADAQASNLVAMVKQMRGLIAYEQSTFEGQYTDLVEQARTLAGRVYAIDREIADQNRLKTEQEALVGARKTDVETLSAELDKARKDLIALLSKQADVERRVFEEQARLRDAQDANVRMERQLRKIETNK